MLDVDTFVQAHLKDALGDKSTLQCFFLTYRTVRNYPPGPVQIKKSGLSIHVSEGGDISHSRMLEMMALRDPTPVKQEARGQLDRAITDSCIPIQDGRFLVVAYAGISALDETIAFLEGVRERSPSATIILVTCNCDMHEKARLLLTCVQRGLLNFALWGYGCGGRDEMAAILNGIIKLWPDASA